MKEVFSILIDNALRYNHTGGSIKVSANKKDGKFTLSISNTGLTLNLKDKKKPFEHSFFRTKEAKELNPNGMGVSLLVAKTIVEAQGGKIWAESEGEGKGSTFVVELPAVT